ncbi:hypothetical protein [Cryobacterium zhongshanensis]|uniref:Uncharacterized protein n=1 Tax=Cryobacterium zhongshanensis TaxID=2928153 RepID=A0AA41QTU5_9MICO|nr:hypothetical protein [Cryobacterium zhongshanensis]MCI4657210.1 hypothetical protein [Cryobacterium zhongshanensis]
MEPEAALTYPGSTEVTTDKIPGRVQFGLDGGDVAATGISATTTHTQLEVLDYYTHALEADGWDQILDNPGMLLPSGARGHSVLWWKTGPKLSYSVLVWAEGETTKYSTEIEARR